MVALSERRKNSPGVVSVPARASRGCLLEASPHVAQRSALAPSGWLAGASRGRIIILTVLLFTLLTISSQALSIAISGNPVKNTNGTGARIEWTTDDFATSRIDYGTTQALGQVVEIQEFTKFHRVQLNGLDPNVKYYFQITSIASSGDFRIANNNGNFYSFTTNPGSDVLPPSFSEVKATSFSATSTTFQWKTNEPATTALYFGEFEPYEAVLDGARVAEHVVPIPTDAGRLYTVIVGGCDATGNCANATPTRVLAGEQSGTPQLGTDIKEFVRQNRIDVNGFTRPFSSVDIFVNNVKQRTVLAEGNGSFKIPNVILNNPSTNQIRVVATDAAGNQAEQEYTTRLDTVPPRITLSSIPQNAIATPLTISGSVDEPVKITYEVQQAFDTTPPARVTGFKTDTVRANSVKLSWADSPEADVHEYAIYRNGIRVATTQQLTYDDPTSSGTAYQYRIAAVDKSCNQGALTDSITVNTPTGGTQLSGQATEAPLTCNPQKQVVNANGQFSFAANLQEGNNQIRITVEDVAGNTVTFLNTTRLDNSPPKFLEDNLDRLSPTYVPEVTVKGRVSEPAAVIVYVNGQQQASEFTDENGYFAIKVQLRRTASSRGNLTSNTPTGNLVLESGVGGFPNEIRIEAVDLAGRKVSKEKTIRYELCGQGSWFNVDVGAVSPSVLTPRLIIEGVQQVGFPVNISYRGAGKVVLKRPPTVIPVTLSLGQQDDWDNGWIQINPMFPRKADGGNIAGYVQLAFTPQPVEPGETTSEKETELANHRRLESDAAEQRVKNVPTPGFATGSDGQCAVPGAGCARFFLQLEIEAVEEIPRRATDPRTQQVTGNVNVEPITQRICMPIEVQMDVPIHLGEKVPKKFLEATSQLLGSAVDTIDSLLQPLTTIGTYTLYGCFAMTAVNFVMYAIEEFACVSSLTGEFDRDIAEIGACDQAYPKDQSSAAGKNAACKKCQDAVANRISFESTMKTVCDRVACPAAPTLQTYIADMQRRGVKATSAQDSQGRQLYAGSSCGFRGGETYYTTTEFEHLPDFRPTVQPVGFGYDAIKSQYIAFQNHKDDAKKKQDAAGSGQSLAGVNCAGLHPANPECCSTEYYAEWGSACGIPGLLETFDELEQSACLAAQSANQLKDFEQAASDAKKSPVTCNSLFNAAAGFCEPNTGKPVSEFIPTGIFYNGLPTQSAHTTQMFIAVRGVPVEDPKTYEVHRGYVYETFVEQRLPAQQRVANAGTSFYLDEKKQFYPDATLTEHFIGKDGPLQAGDVSKFAAALCTGLPDKSLCNSRARNVYEQVRSYITVPEKTYIVRPEGEGVLRAAQCVCIPAVTSYLGFWRNVLGHVKQCVDHTRLTGEGSSGVCKAVLSQYVCDMLYDFLRCFMRKFSSPGAGARPEARGIGDVLGGLTRAGSRMEQNIQGRYGQTALWQTMFTERKLLHGICAFAFTGQWDLNVEGLFQQTIDTVPIESQGLIYPAERRFVSYNPVTKPTGLTTWVYHFGVGLVAGADLRYDMYLKCSNSIRCNPSAGFKDGKCDCFGKQEKTLPVIANELGNGQLRRNDILNAEVFFTVQAENTGSEVRYDTAVLEWEYTDSRNEVRRGKVETPIGLAGTDAPNFCKVELLDSPMFLCRFNVGDYAGAVLRDPVLKTPPNNVLVLGKQAEFGVPINLFGTSDPRTQGGATTSQNTKFLVYSLRNGNGVEVATNKNTALPINTEGEKEHLVRTEVITQAMFARSTGGAQMTDRVSVRAEGMPNPNDPKGYALTIIDNERSSIQLPPAQPATDLVLVIKGSTVEVYQLGAGPMFGTYTATSDDAAARAIGQWGYWPKPSQSVILGTGTLNANIITIAGPLGNVIPGNGRIVIALKSIPAAVGNKYPEILFRYASATGSLNLCDSFKTTPDTWTATFTLYDAKKPTYGGAYEPNFAQETTDSEGNKQMRTVKVQAVCADSYAPTVPTQGGVVQGFPAEFRFCSNDPAAENPLGCFCGTIAEAQNAMALNLLEHNCGPSSEGQRGRYCGYAATGRVCTTTPIVDAPVLFDLRFVELDSNNVQIGAPKPVSSAFTISLEAGKSYQLITSAYYPQEYQIESGVRQVGLRATGRQTTLVVFNSVTFGAGTEDIQILVRETADLSANGKSRTYTLKVSAS